MFFCCTGCPTPGTFTRYLGNYATYRKSNLEPDLFRVRCQDTGYFIYFLNAYRIAPSPNSHKNTWWPIKEFELDVATIE